jgi:hypothetical protein
MTDGGIVAPETGLDYAVIRELANAADPADIKYGGYQRS